MSIVHLQKFSGVEIDQGLLNQAIGFFNAGYRCMANVCITPLITNSPMSPAIVCFAFSIELYLKLVHVLSTGQTPKGHKLEELFSSLPESSRQSLAAKYGSAELPSHIATVSTAFVDWRYEHEHETLAVNPQVLINIATCCHKLARELKPELKVFGENQVIQTA
ncbi:MAG: HEPN domain-containing protein [Betaproteobacteria bacterium]|nr:HEPN domain-containing protein [Betaproteobacteria bacterium]